MWKLLFMILVFIIVYRLYMYKPIEHATLNTNGFELIDVFTENEVNLIREYAENDENMKAADFVKKSARINEIILKRLGVDYVFPNYSFVIKKSQLSSCHRDDNGTMINTNSQYPSYTLIIFLKPMENCLKVIEGSHKKQDKFYITKPPENIKCSPGQMIIFDSNLVHAGAFNENINNTRIQMKLVHRNDMENHPELKNFHKELKNDKKPTHFAKIIDQPISCIAPVLSDKLRFKKGKGARLYEKLLYKNNLGL